MNSVHLIIIGLFTLSISYWMNCDSFMFLRKHELSNLAMLSNLVMQSYL